MFENKILLITGGTDFRERSIETLYDSDLSEIRILAEMKKTRGYAAGFQQ